MSIKVINSGLMTTIQDNGRMGYQASGMQVSGDMDRYSASIANALVGNDGDAALLECTYLGPELEASEDVLVAVTGGEPKVLVDNQPAHAYESLILHKGQHLKVASMEEGTRAYIAIDGGIDVPLVLGSHSTNLKLGIGGADGSKLYNGEVLNTGEPSELAKSILSGQYHVRHTDHEFMQHHHLWHENHPGDSHEIRIVLGPQDDYFTPEAVKALDGAVYTISNESDRMGYRLEGEVIHRATQKDMITDGIVFGSIQVPPNGQPIIMMADHQTTGGYPKIATVISADLPLLAQCSPGSKITFKVISVEEAQDIYISFRKALQEQIALMDEEAAEEWPDRRPGVRNYNLKIDGQLFRVSVEQIK
ncbi:Allophanate hydrolase 2 subunit 2 [Anaerovibrio sp. JC8]|uniref:5-oxoprolinase subunit C family protein n=1 Tax=Anaerovibrio sp. JC8 TaxID=1240085 RepID=UPI000A098179|nr:biotin-dependent carboxyltransferase family protein [Anaerovibrio sp. JC8]ORU00625.1 Allophanate hydrolase 2 subunit 2 [Anaerovibrio sp. JC8]